MTNLWESRLTGSAECLVCADLLKEEFAKEGIEVTTLCGMNFDLKDGLPAYHTLRDTVKAVDPEVVSAAILIGIGFVDSLEN